MTVRQKPPTTSMHITKEETMVPPLAMARTKRSRRKLQNQGAKAAAMLHKAWIKMQIMSTVFRPYLSAATPKRTFPIKSLLVYDWKKLGCYAFVVFQALKF